MIFLMCIMINGNDWILEIIIEKSFEIVRRYEANGLQLDGYGCWLLGKVFVTAQHRITDCYRYPPPDILELILRIMLEHKVYLVMKNALVEIISNSPNLFDQFCEIGIRIADELPQPIACGNFAALFDFVMFHLRTSTNIRVAATACQMLQLIACRVESTPRSEYFVRRVSDVIHRLLADETFTEGYSIHYAEPTQALKRSTTYTVYNLLKAMVPLHHSHARIFMEVGFVQSAISCVKHKPHDNSADTDTDGVLGAIHFLTRVASHAPVLSEILKAFSVDDFIELVQSSASPSVVEAAVALFSDTYGNLYASSHHLTAAQGLQFVSAVLNRALLVLSEDRSGAQDIPKSSSESLCRALRHLTRGSWAVIHICSEAAEASRMRTTLIELLQLIISEREEGQGGFAGESGDVCVALFMDVLAVLSGWVDVCWLGCPAPDDAIDMLISSTEDSFIFSTGGVGGCSGEKESFLNEEGARPSLITSLMPYTSPPSLGSGSMRSLEDPDVEGSTDDVATMQLSSGEEEDFAHERAEGIPDILSTDHFTADMDETSAVSKESLRGEVHICHDKLADFVTEWELDSTNDVCQKIFALVGVSRSQSRHLERGSALLCLDGMNVDQLAEVIVELVVDERHGIHGVPGASEKCIQLLTDVAHIGEVPCSIALGAIDAILETISNWENWTDSFLMQTCLSALIVFAEGQSSCRKLIMSSLDKVDAMLCRTNSLAFLFAAIKLCQKLMSVMSKLSLDGETIVVNWVMRCMCTEWMPLVACACHLLVELSTVNRPLMFKGFSRRELEIPMINLMKQSNDIASVLIALRTLALSAANFNERPFWVFDSWSYPLSTTGATRELSSVEFMYDLLEVMRKFPSPHNFVILSYGLTILTFLEEVPSIRDSEVHTLKFQSIYVPELATLLAVLCQSYDFVSTNAMHRSEKRAKLILSLDAPEPSVDLDEICVAEEFEEGLYESLLRVELHGLNASYELMCAAAMQTLHALVCYGDFLDLSLYQQYEEFFAATPVCEAVLYIMIQLPHNYIIQSKGIAIVQKLIDNGYGLRIFGECCSKVLIGAMVAYNDDTGVHRAFCSIVNNLAKRGEFERTRLVSSSAYKWLYVVIKAASPENAPMACMAISNITGESEERAEAMGNAGLVRTVLLLLDKHASILKVQVEGLRTIVMLCRSQVCLRQMKMAGGTKKIKRARDFLKSILAASSNGKPLAILDQSPYSRDDLVQLLLMSSPGKMGEKCILS